MPVVRLVTSSSGDPEAVLEALGDPGDLFQGIPGVRSYRRYSELGIHQITITYRRFLTTYRNTIHFVVSREGDRVVYTSLEPNRLKAVFRAYRGVGTTVVEAEISYEPPGGGQAAVTAIEGIFRGVIEKAEEKAARIETARPRTQAKVEVEMAVETPRIEEIKAPIASQAEKEPSKPIEVESINCLTCLLYEPELRICTYFDKKSRGSRKNNMQRREIYKSTQLTSPRPKGRGLLLGWGGLGLYFLLKGLALGRVSGPLPLSPLGDSGLWISS